MKIYLGPYRNYCDFFKNSISRKAELNCNNSKFWKWVDSHEKIHDVVRSLDEFVDVIWYKRWWYNLPRGTGKSKIRIDYYDTWNLDHTLAKIILPSLKLLKEKNHGTPYVEDEDVPAELSGGYIPFFTYHNHSEEEGNYQSKLLEDRWNYVQDKMIWSFEQILDDSAENKFFEPVFDKEAYTAYHKEIDVGLRLFGKYFRALWD